MTNETLKVFEHLTGSGSKSSIELSLLSGHLLIESAIKILLEKKLEKPSSINLERMKFDQTQRWLRAIMGDSEFNWQWEAIIKLNKLRNAFAHKLEKPDFQKDIDEFIDFVKRNHSREYFKTNFSKKEKLVWAITSVHTHLMGALQNEN